MPKQFFVLLASTILVLSVTSCSQRMKQPTKVILKHPVTQDFVNCNVDEWRTKNSYQKNEECIQNYQKEGYVVWGKR